MKFQYEKEYDNVFDELKDRGYFEAATDEEELAEKLKNEKFETGTVHYEMMK